MQKITLDGKLDHLFSDDRDARIETLDEKVRVPSYGGNNLYKPNRPLTKEESEIANQIGTAKTPSDS
jgi:hypothetical protein